MNSSAKFQVCRRLAGFCLCFVLFPLNASATGADSCQEALRIGDACDRMIDACSDLNQAAADSCHDLSFLPESGDCDYLKRGSEICNSRVAQCIKKRDAQLDLCEQTGSADDLTIY